MQYLIFAVNIFQLNAPFTLQAVRPWLEGFLGGGGQMEGQADGR